jgi:hypothetical protein
MFVIVMAADFTHEVGAFLLSKVSALLNQISCLACL